jgi:hypothetical protein
MKISLLQLRRLLLDEEFASSGEALISSYKDFTSSGEAITSSNEDFASSGEALTFS